MPAQAQSASCWGAEEASAAHVRQMQTMLMVTALRCRAAGIDMSADYNGFVTKQQAAITHAGLVIRHHLGDDRGDTGAYDRFATSLANGYGDGRTTVESCAAAAALARDGAAAEATTLDGMAIARATLAALPGGVCGEAPAAPLAAMPPLLALAAPAPLAPRPAVAAPVSLPQDVVAALAVLARFQSAQTAIAAAKPVSPAAAIAPIQVASALTH